MACAAFAILFGIRFIYFGQMNGDEGTEPVMRILANGPLIAAAFILVCWALAFYRLYKRFQELFTS